LGGAAPTGRDWRIMSEIEQKRQSATTAIRFRRSSGNVVADGVLWPMGGDGDRG
jgi:hypothetical protein